MSVKEPKFSVNEDIKAQRVIVIGFDGSKKGEFLKSDAIKLAESEGLDLVLVGDGEKPICKIMDFGKYLYDQKKKLKANVSHSVETKEIRFGLQTDEGYLDIKANQARGFLNKGDKVKVAVKFRGREIAHLDIIRNKCLAFFDKLQDIAEMEQPPKITGNNVSMMLVVKK